MSQLERVEKRLFFTILVSINVILLTVAFVSGTWQIALAVVIIDSIIALIRFIWIVSGNVFKE